MGKVEAIYLAPEKGAAMWAVAEVEAHAGKGLRGEHHYREVGGFPDLPMAPSEVTLIEAEAVEAFANDLGVSFSVGQTRRNIVTRGIALNSLVGRRLRVGEVVLEGIRLCEPCAHLVELTIPEVLPGLLHRGGLRARILQGGTIRLGDPIGEVVEEALETQAAS
jgi:hypothetical protein